MTDNQAVIDDDFSPAEWRKHRNISKSTGYKLKRLGLAPEELRIPGMTFVRITRRADREWEARMAKLAQEQSADLERQRRVEMCRRAGNLAAASPRHISKTRKKRSA